MKTQWRTCEHTQTPRKGHLYWVTCAHSNGSHWVYAVEWTGMRWDNGDKPFCGPVIAWMPRREPPAPYFADDAPGSESLGDLEE